MAKTLSEHGINYQPQPASPQGEKVLDLLSNFIFLDLLLISNFSILQLPPLVPVHQFDKLPSYFIFAGLVFVPLTQPYLHEYGEDWYNTSPRRLCERALRELPGKANEQLVILSQVIISGFHIFLLEIVSACATC